MEKPEKPMYLASIYDKVHTQEFLMDTKITY